MGGVISWEGDHAKYAGLSSPLNSTVHFIGRLPPKTLSGARTTSHYPVNLFPYKFVIPLDQSALLKVIVYG